MGPIGVPEMIVIFVLALVLFGPRKLPELGRTIGKAMTEFRRASNDLKATFEREMQSLERENQSIQAETRKTAREIADHASYDMAPSDKLWNALDDLVNDDGTKTQATPEHGSEPLAIAEASETAPEQEHPATVGASAVSGAESTGELAAAEEPVGPTGRVARGHATDEPEPPTHS